MIANPELRNANRCMSSVLFATIAVVLAASLNAEDKAASEEIHWAFRPLTRPKIPQIRSLLGCETDLDRFILARQEAVGLEPNPPIDARGLVRRVYFDLTGLPPTPREIDAFVADPSPHAYAELVSRLLESPRYGERWGRHWLDLARYADSKGYRYDDNTTWAWTYRDFVVRAFNSDMPFDQFLRWQIAGDELAPGYPDALAATGFCAIGPIERDEGTKRNKLENRYNELDDIVSTVGSSALALTIGCARCHDHKFDPILQREYYSLAGAFMTGARRELELLTAAALLTDLKRRGLLEQTLVVWGGEFGRLPVSEKGVGRDHNPYGFLMWMAGGGVKGGVSFGETDEIGYKAVTNAVSLPDLHATILHLMGLDHELLTFPHSGRDFRLTDVSGEVIKPLLA